MWRFYFFTHKQLEKFYNRAYGHGLRDGVGIGRELERNHGVIFGCLTKPRIQSEVEKILKEKGV